MSDHSNLKVLTPKQMLQRLLMALAEVKAVNTSENLLMKSEKSYNFCITKLLKKYTSI